MAKIGDLARTALDFCVEAPASNQVLGTDTSGRLILGLIGSAQIAANAIQASHVAAFDQLIFGVPVDGSFVADGIATMPGTSQTSLSDWQASHRYAVGTVINPSGANSNIRQLWICTTKGTSAGSQPTWPSVPVTPQADGSVTWTFVTYFHALVRDVNFNRLVVNSGVTILTNGNRLFANTLQLNGTAVIHNDGASGLTADGATLADTVGAITAGSGALSYSVDAGKLGGAGGSVAQGTPGSKGGAGRTILPALGGAGGLGGMGTSGTGGAHTSPGGQATPSTVTKPASSPYYFPKIVQLFDESLVRGISGGGAGSAGGGGGSGTTVPTGDGGPGGGSGAGGGVCLVVAGVLDTATGSWTGRISANGGDGGSGVTGSSVHGGTGGAGGGGGGGGAIVVTRCVVGNLALSTALGVTPPAAVMARGGALGNAGDTTSATIASPGVAIVLNLSQPFVPPNEFGRPPILDARPLYPRPRSPGGKLF